MHLFFAQLSGDAPSYLDPIDNFINTGTYHLGTGDNMTPFGRAPYYGVVYYIFRLFFLPKYAYDCVAIVQIFFESVSILFLCFLSLKIIQRKVAFWTTYLLMILSLNATIYSNYLLTESFSSSFLIIFSYYFYSFLIRNRNRDLLIAGLFLALATMLKPYFSLLYLPIGVSFIFKKVKGINQVFLRSLIVAIPLILLSTPYTLRNLITYKRFLPSSELYAGATYTKADFAYRRFIISWGGSYVFWDKRSAGSYFQPNEKIKSEFTFPSYAISNGYTIQDIEKTRNMYVRYQISPNPNLEDSVTYEFNRLTSLFIADHKIRYHFISPLLLFKQYVFHSGSYFLPISKTFPCYRSYQMLIKISQSCLYYFTLFAGFAGLILMFFKNKKTFMNLTIPLFLLLFFPFVLSNAESRYFINAYPFLILGSVFTIVYFLKQYKFFSSKITV